MPPKLAHGLPDLRGCASIVSGVLAFMGPGRYGGLLPVTFTIIFISALGGKENTPRQAALLALGIQIPLFGWGG